MKTSTHKTNSLLKYSVIFLFGMSVLYFTSAYTNINTSLTNATQYIQKIILTSDGNQSGTTGIVLDGNGTAKVESLCIWWDCKNARPNCDLTWNTQSGEINYTEEMVSAYDYAYNNWITTMYPINNADVYGNITRSEMARIISHFAENILGKSPDLSKSCSFSDLNGLSQWVVADITKACQLGIMWYEEISFNDFDPNAKVTRAEFWTFLSKAMRGDQYNWGTPYYSGHLSALKNAGIISNIENVNFDEIRGYSWLLIQRAGEYITTELDICNIPENMIACSLGLDICPSECASNTTGWIHSTVIGYNTQANGDYSTVMWYNTQANGDYSTAMWYSTISNWRQSTAIWLSSIASGDQSIAIWEWCISNWISSMAMWDSTEANWRNSITMWFMTKANWDSSLSIWRGNVANWFVSSAFGLKTVANWDYSTVIWVLNEGIVNSIFEIWIWTLDPEDNETNDVHRNAMTVLNNGKIGIGTTLPSALLTVDGGIKPVKATSDPCADTNNYAEWTMFYNDNSNYYCFCDATTTAKQMHAPATSCF